MNIVEILIELYNFIYVCIWFGLVGKCKPMLTYYLLTGWELGPTSSLGSVNTFNLILKIILFNFICLENYRELR